MVEQAGPQIDERVSLPRDAAGGVRLLADQVVQPFLEIVKVGHRNTRPRRHPDAERARTRFRDVCERERRAARFGDVACNPVRTLRLRTLDQRRERVVCFQRHLPQLRVQWRGGLRPLLDQRLHGVVQSSAVRAERILRRARKPPRAPGLLHADGALHLVGGTPRHRRHRVQQVARVLASAHGKRRVRPECAQPSGDLIRRHAVALHGGRHALHGEVVRGVRYAARERAADPGIAQPVLHDSRVARASDDVAPDSPAALPNSIQHAARDAAERSAFRRLCRDIGEFFRASCAAQRTRARARERRCADAPRRRRGGKDTRYRRKPTRGTRDARRHARAGLQHWSKDRIVLREAFGRAAVVVPPLLARGVERDALEHAVDAALHRRKPLVGEVHQRALERADDAAHGVRLAGFLEGVGASTHCRLLAHVLLGVGNDLFLGRVVRRGYFVLLPVRAGDLELRHHCTFRTDHPCTTPCAPGGGSVGMSLASGPAPAASPSIAVRRFCAFCNFTASESPGCGKY